METGPVPRPRRARAPRRRGEERGTSFHESRRRWRVRAREPTWWAQTTPALPHPLCSSSCN